MPRLINREILQRETGWTFDRFEFGWIQYLIEKTGEIDFYVMPEDFFPLIRGLNATTGRTKDDQVYAMMYGIRFIMLSGEKLQKYRVLL